jgi:hypothetical protein
MARQPDKQPSEKTNGKTKIQHYAAPVGMPDAQGDVYEDIKPDDENDPGAYLGDQYIMLGDEHPEGPWK